MTGIRVRKLTGFNIYKHGGRLDMGIDAVEWAMKAEKLGAGRKADAENGDGQGH